jgi:hypothetical protein
VIDPDTRRETEVRDIIAVLPAHPAGQAVLAMLDNVDPPERLIDEDREQHMMLTSAWWDCHAAMVRAVHTALTAEVPF